jgi:hypothetical protein
MFERYTDKAKRVIFFARYEASELGSPVIESEFLLLGILREEPYAATRWLGCGTDWIAGLREEIARSFPAGKKIATSVDLPLSDEVQRILGYAVEEVERLAHQHIGVEHLFLGLLREPKSRAGQLLRSRGIQANTVRETMEKELTDHAFAGLSFGGQRKPVAVAIPQESKAGSLGMPQASVVVQESDESIPLAWPARIPVTGDVLSLDRGQREIASYRVVGVEWEITAGDAEPAALSRVQIKVRAIHEKE